MTYKSNHKDQKRRNHNQSQPKAATLTAIPSRYNFVPLPRKVFFPDEASGANAKVVSHDLPFKDGLSGSIEVSVTAESPIFIGDGDANFFQLPDGRHAIPGTSLKGAMRSVMEIISASILECHNRKYSIRDIKAGLKEIYTGWMTYTRGGTHRPAVRAGWLSWREGAYHITPCEFCRVEQTDVETVLGKGSILAEGAHAKFKYARIGQRHLKLTFALKKDHRHPSKNLVYDKATAIDLANKSVTVPDRHSGTLVVTGQPSKRDKAKSAKHMEFIFYNNPAKTYPAYKVPADKMEDFEFVHSSDQPKSGDDAANKMGSPNEEWKFWKDHIRQGGKAPVFYLAYDEAMGPKPGQQSAELSDGQTQLYAFGLAMMFRLPMATDIHTARSNSAPGSFQKRSSANPESSPRDLTETIMGFIDGQQCLRGRVNFEPLPETKPTQPLEEKKVLLASPKASYYPNYLVQKGNDDTGELQGDYVTLNDPKAELSGWKRYPVRESAIAPSVPNGLQNMASMIRPLPDGTTFKGKVFFHNLRPFELGALLWALTWGGLADKENLRHSLGMGKPLGYGRVKIATGQIECLDCLSVPSTSELIEAFTRRMEEALPGWWASDTLVQLKAMANPALAENPVHPLDYPVLVKGNNQFAMAKNKQITLFLKPYALPRGGSIVTGQTNASSSIGESKPLGSALPARERPVTERFPKGTRVVIVAYRYNKKKENWRFHIQGEPEGKTGGTIVKEHRGRIGSIQKGNTLKASVKTPGEGAFIFILEDEEPITA